MGIMSAGILALIGGVYLSYGLRSDLHIGYDENGTPTMYRDSPKIIKQKASQRTWGGVFLVGAFIMMFIGP